MRDVRLGIGALVLLMLSVAACSAGAPAPAATAVPEAVALTLESDAFVEGGAIPSRYTCDGDDLSPPLRWGEPPAPTGSLALIVDDPDAPGGTWVHWVLYDIPPEVRALEEGAPPPAGSTEGHSSWGRAGYGGPCPPSGTHRYVFALYALDGALGLEPGATRDDVLRAAEGRILAVGQLVGTYSR